MLKQILLLILPIAGIGLMVFGCLLTYSDRFFRYWYSDRDFSNEPNKYLMARYWAGSHGALSGFGLIAMYILFNEKLARYLMSFFY
jgi:hypothetical protein